MSVVIRLKREGRKNLPSYRLSVADPRAPRDGAVIERLGFYDPRAKTPEAQVKINVERAAYWVEQGARLSPTVRTLLRDAGVTTFRAKPVRDRSGRGKKTATKARRTAAKDARVAAKSARPAHRRKPKQDEKKK